MSDDVGELKQSNTEPDQGKTGVSPESIVSFPAIDIALASFAESTVSEHVQEKGGLSLMEQAQEVADYAKVFCAEYGIDPNTPTEARVHVWDENDQPSLALTLTEKGGIPIDGSGDEGARMEVTLYFDTPRTTDEGTYRSLSVQRKEIVDTVDTKDGEKWILTHTHALMQKDEDGKFAPTKLRIEGEGRRDKTSAVFVCEEGKQNEIEFMAYNSETEKLGYQLVDEYKEETGKEMASHFYVEKGDSDPELPSRDRVREFKLRFFERHWGLP